MRLTQAQLDIFLSISVMEMLVKLDMKLEATKELIDMFEAIASHRIFFTNHGIELDD